jgi:hypothetical protein
LEARDNPSNPSGAYLRMQDAWKTIDDILEGPDCIRAAGVRYLPKNPAETRDEYDRRRKTAPWQPEFDDILRGLSAKPFAKDIGLRDGASTQIKALAEDIDGKGNSLSAFSQPAFRSGLARGMSAVLVDNTGRGQARTVAEERAAGVRPYWVPLQATDIIDLKTAFVGGKEQPYHVRLKECLTERDGYAEKTVERIREMNRAPTQDERGEITALGPPLWILWEKQKGEDGQDKWANVAEGKFEPLTEIPLALFWTGEREGAQFVRPPLYAIADKQIELYRTGSRNEEAFNSVGYPMYAANGLAPPQGEEVVETGPNRILYAAAPGASWDVISADADALRVLLEDKDKRTDAIRRLGMQPITQRTGTATATEIAIEGARAHSALEAWANAFRDMLEQAFVFTSQWLRQDATVELDWTIDFMAGLADQPSLDALFKAYQTKAISRVAYIQGLKRFGVLPADFDEEADEEQLATEMQGLEPEPVDPTLDPANDPPQPKAA